MQMSPYLNGDGGRHKAQLETGREERWGSVKCLEGEGRGGRKTLAVSCQPEETGVQTHSDTKSHTFLISPDKAEDL